jgi:hypothetical protein
MEWGNYQHLSPFDRGRERVQNAHASGTAILGFVFGGARVFREFVGT